MELNKQTMKKIMFLIAFTIALAVGLPRVNSLLGLIGYLVQLFMPFIIGGCFAFIVNIPMSLIETHLLPRCKNRILNQFHRAVSIMLSLIFIIGIIAVISILIIPEFVDKVSMLIGNFSYFVETIGDSVNEFADSNSQLKEWLNNLNIDWSSIGANVTQYIKDFCNTLFSSTLNIASKIINGMMNFMISIMFGLYLVARKEEIAKQGKEVMYAYLPEKLARKFHRFLLLCNHTFRKFITGQCLEAIIQFTLFFIVLTFLNYPYALIISMFISFMSLIPILGSYISSYTSAFLLCMINPWKALFFLLIFMIVQQLDTSFIYPKVVGNSVGLPPMWVIMAVSLGGRLLGIIGMITFIPLASIIYHLVGEGTAKRLKKKELNVDNITVTEFCSEEEDK